jgi:hypothetical protein
MEEFSWISSLLGALIGGAASLLGTAVTQFWTAKREEAARRAAETARRDRELREAYADFLSANQKALMMLSSVVALAESDEKRAIELVTAFTSDATAFGTKVRLMEDDADARRKTAEALEIVSVLAAQLFAAKAEDFRNLLGDVDAAAQRLAKLETWIQEQRFPAKANEA